MHLVVGDVTSLPEVYRINDFVIAVWLIAVEVLGLPAVS